MDTKDYIFGGIKKVELEEDELSRLEVYAPNAQDYNLDNGIDPCGGALGPCMVNAIT